MWKQRAGIKSKKESRSMFVARDLWLDACSCFFSFYMSVSFFDSIFYQKSVRFGRRNVKKRSAG